jgi:prepilin-type N-terminal cleavage/methylation domain-containing protein
MDQLLGDCIMARECKPANKRPQSQQGFTLIEVMIAMFCFVVVTLALTLLTTNTWRGVTQSRTTTEASVLGGRILEGILSRSYQDGEIQNGAHGPLTQDNYTINYTISDDAILPRTKCIQVDISYNLGRSAKNVRMNYLLPEIVD